MTKTKAVAEVTLSNLNTATKPAGLKKPKTAKANKVNRVANGRREITAALRSLTKLERTFVKTADTLAVEGQALKGEMHDQMAQVLSQIGVAITVTQAEISVKANELARTFIR